LTACSLTQYRIPKYERLKRMAERYGDLGLEPSSMEAYLLLVSLVSEMREIASCNFAKYGLAEGRVTVLALLLERQPEPISHSRLAELLGVTKGSITGLVDGLEHDGYVKREDRGEDRRTRLISLTPDGLELIDRALPEKFRGIAGLMGGLSVAERETLVSLLLKVQEGLPAYRSK
jgi:DNA-binding MarR family transcriptional regulator